MSNIIVIKNPSESLIKFVREMREKQEAQEKEIRENWVKYFPNNRNDI